MNFLAPIITLGGLGIAFGLALAYASKKFHVDLDPTLEKVIATLPGVNCGACGKAGCSAFAEALYGGGAALKSCTVCNDESRGAIAKILNLNVGETVKQVAVLHCQGGVKVKDKFLYFGMRDCIAANLSLGGHKSCTWGCIGFGSCAKACPFCAITMNGETGLPQVDESKCTACGNCVRTCPKHIFSLIPVDVKGKIYIACSSQDAGRVVMQSCKVGCIGCKKCETTCKFDAIKVVDNLARIDYEKCVGCMQCVKVCPTKVIIQRKAK
ncbi:RnfABCDGE type electron transport complex subunit B [Thermoproteota archaeon]